MLKHRPLYLFSLTLFFWSIFDGIISYITPLLLVQNGLSETTMGLVIASSSVFGALFDFLLSKFLKNTHFRRLYLFLFALCFIYPLLLWQVKVVWLYLIVMGLWGLYYDLMNFGLYDFVSRKTEKEEFSSSFGVVSVFKSLGYLLGPIFAGLVIGQLIGWLPFFLSLIFLLIGLIFFIMVLTLNLKIKPAGDDQFHFKKTSFLKELGLWEKIGRKILPVLIFIMLLNIIDAFFWTIGPLFAESLAGLHPLGGLLITFYMLPPLLVGWTVGSLTAKLGKKRTAYYSALLGSVGFVFLTLTNKPLLILLIVFVSSTLQAVAWPAIRATFTDYISETPTTEKEIEGLADFFANLGYIVGPLSAGFLADRFGHQPSFTILGIISIIAIIFLMNITPKKINL